MMKRNVALFIACLTDQFYPRVGIAVTRLLEHFGCRVHFPDSQTCCGQPFYNNGFHAEAKSFATRFVETFETFDYIVTPSGSCCAMVREHYHDLLKDDPAYATGMNRVGSRTFEFVEFLTDILQVDLGGISLPAPRTITYHYTCHLRGLGVTDQSANLLEKIGNVNFVPMKKADQCCGFGGTFAMKYPAISGAIVEDKTNCIAATRADSTICNDAGCTMNIAGMCHRRGIQTRVTHIAELLAEAMGIEIDEF